VADDLASPAIQYGEIHLVTWTTTRDGRMPSHLGDRSRCVGPLSRVIETRWRQAGTLLNA
jgi:hypothetical protein